MEAQLACVSCAVEISRCILRCFCLECCTNTGSAGLCPGTGGEAVRVLALLRPVFLVGSRSWMAHRGLCCHVPSACHRAPGVFQYEYQ